jgi:hypothetical protein
VIAFGLADCYSGFCASRSEAPCAQIAVRAPEQLRPPVTEFNEVASVIFNR